MNSFEASACRVDKKLDHFTKYVRRQRLVRFMVQYELFKMQLNIKGSIVECGVHHGSGVMAWAKLSSILEPYNYHRKIIGFDTFEGFPEVADIDKTSNEVKKGMFAENYNVYDELKSVIAEYNENRFLNQKEKIELVKGDANETIPRYLAENQHLIISLLYLDFDIYQPTVTALQHFLKRMPAGAILAFDEVSNPDWPGETKAMFECLDLNRYKLQCFPFEPNISYIQL